MNLVEGVIWNMVIAFGKIRDAREKGREEGRREGLAEALADGLAVGRKEGRAEERAAMIRALRAAGIPEADIRRVEVEREAQGNGSMDKAE